MLIRRGSYIRCTEHLRMESVFFGKYEGGNGLRQCCLQNAQVKLCNIWIPS